MTVSIDHRGSDHDTEESCQACGGRGWVTYVRQLLDGTIEDPPAEGICECLRLDVPEVLDSETRQIIDGRKLFANYGDEIISSYRKGSVWVPSRSRPGLKHEVKSRKEICGCEYNEFGHKLCAHIFAGTMALSKSATCAACKKRVHNRYVIYAEEGQGGFSEGQPICRSCADIRGVA